MATDYELRREILPLLGRNMSTHILFGILPTTEIESCASKLQKQGLITIWFARNWDVTRNDGYTSLHFDICDTKSPLSGE